MSARAASWLMVVSLRIPLLAEANSVVKSRNGDGGVWHSTLAIPLKLKRMTSQTLQGAPPGCDSPRMLPLASCIPSRIVLHSSTRNSPMPGTKEPTIRPWRAAGARLQSRWGERVAEFLRQPRTAASGRGRGRARARRPPPMLHSQQNFSHRPNSNASHKNESRQHSGP